MIKLFDFECEKCSHRFAEWSKNPSKGPKCSKCGGKTYRKFSVSVIVPGYMKAENLTGNERQKAFVNSPAVRKGRDEGKYVIADPEL